MPLSNTFNSPFIEQVDFFRKKINLPSERWDDIKKSAHDRGFIVAGANKADLVADLRNTIDKCIAEGKSLGWYQKNFDEIVKKNGWTGWTGEGTKAGRDWRTTITYQTNMATSYAAGRWTQLHDPDLVKFRPYLTYHHADGVRHPRPLHQSWNGFTAPRDDPFWLTHFAPNGWRCHCYISAASESDYADAKAAGRHKPPEGWDEIDPKTGEQVGIDKGFGYAPGANASRPMKDFIDQKLIKLDAPIGAAMAEALKPVLLTERAAAVREMVVKTILAEQFIGASEIAHVVAPMTVADLAARGEVLSDAAVWLRDEELHHALRDKKAAPLTGSVWMGITNYLDQASPYWDTVDKRLIYVFDTPNELGKVAIRVNFTHKVRVDGARINTKSNFIRSGGVIDPIVLDIKTKQGRKRYELLEK